MFLSDEVEKFCIYFTDYYLLGPYITNPLFSMEVVTDILVIKAMLSLSANF